MVDSGIHDSSAEGLGEFLRHRARRASDRRLAADTAIGVIVAAGALIWRPAGWAQLLLAAVCIGAFGIWGIVDRELLERVATSGASPRSLRFGRGAAAAVGGTAALMLLLSLFALAVGTWKS
jgi:hypothetical protein